MTDASGEMGTTPDTSEEMGEWKNTILAGLANYIDAGSIVAGSVALALWKTEYSLSDKFSGLIGP